MAISVDTLPIMWWTTVAWIILVL